MYDIFVKLLQSNNVKVSEVARKTNISKTTFTDWKNGRSVPKADKLQKIADYFGVTVDYLMTGKSNTSNEPTEDDIRIALFDGDKDVTPEMWEEVKNYAKLSIDFLYKSHIIITTEPDMPLDDAYHVGSFN